MKSLFCRVALKSIDKLFFNPNAYNKSSTKSIQLLKEKLLPACTELEKEFIVNEIFDEQCYIHPKFTIPKHNAIFIDCGAHAGWFSSFCNAEYFDSKIFSIEMIPETFETCEKNTQISQTIFSGNNNTIQCLNYALSNEKKDIECIYYPYLPCVSTVKGSKDPSHWKNDQVTFSTNYYLNQSTGSGFVRWVFSFKMSQRLGKQIAILLFNVSHSCPKQVKIQATTLSQLIEDHNLEHEVIDLIKIDCEAHEYQVLQGIREEHFKNIRNFVIEVETNLESIVDLLQRNGFCIDVKQEGAMKDTQMFQVFAFRES
eukprot:167836_1